MSPAHLAGLRRLGVCPMARVSVSLGSQEEDERDQHQGSPDPHHSAERELPDVELMRAISPA